MQYTKPKFSVPMPGAGVDWPFGKERDGQTCWYEECPVCHAQVSCWSDFMPAHHHADDERRPVKRVCFGR